MEIPLALIASYLTIKEILLCKLICKKWKELLDKKEIWEQAFIQIHDIHYYQTNLINIVKNIYDGFIVYTLLKELTLMTKVIWEYEIQKGEWIPVIDDSIEEFYQTWLKNREENGLVYHCFGDEWSVGVSFGEMKTHCLSSHKPTLKCPHDNHNMFNLRRNFYADNIRKKIRGAIIGST